MRRSAFQAGCRGFEPRLPLSRMNRLCAGRLQAASEQPGGERLGMGRFFFLQKGVQRHPASISRATLPSRVGEILPLPVRAHYVTRNRTQGLDSFPFFSAQDSSQTSFAVAFVFVSGNGQGVCLLSPPVAFSSSLQKGCVFDREPGICCPDPRPGSCDRQHEFALHMELQKLLLATTARQIVT